MKKLLASMVLVGSTCLVYADSAAATTMMVSSGVTGPSQVNMAVVNNMGQAPQVKINLNAPATLTVYDQNNKVAFTQNLQPGVTTVDTANFPLGNDMLVVTVNQTGSTFTMKQSVTVTAPTQSGS